MNEITICGKTLTADFMDADFMKVFEEKSKEFYERAKKNQTRKFNSTYEGMIETCEVVEKYFDEVFGDGTSKELFGGSHNVQTHLEAVAELTDAHSKSRKEFNDFSNRYIQRQGGYRPHKSGK